MALVAIHFGLGRHWEDVPPAYRPIATKYTFLAAVIYIVLSYLVKVVVGLFLVRICSGNFTHPRDMKLKIWRLIGQSLSPKMATYRHLVHAWCCWLVLRSILFRRAVRMPYVNLAFSLLPREPAQRRAFFTVRYLVLTCFRTHSIHMGTIRHSPFHQRQV